MTVNHPLRDLAWAPAPSQVWDHEQEPVQVADRSLITFPDGGSFRIEIPSVEGPDALDVVLAEAAKRDVIIHRVSQGSGVSMLSDDEISQMVTRCAASAVELCLFLGPRAVWDVGASALSPGGGIGSRVRGGDQLRFSIDDARRAVALGVRSLLVADEGVLWLLHRMRVAGELPHDLHLKMSALSGPANPVSFEVIERLGADSINIPSDLSILQLSELRAHSRAPIDMYVESPDTIGGFVRHHEIPQFIASSAPIYLKFGLRNAPDIYPSGGHLRSLPGETGRERVRRAALGLDLLRRLHLLDTMSPAGAVDVGELRRFDVDDTDVSASAGRAQVPSGM